MPHHHPTLDEFRRLARQGNLVPVYRRLMADQITPVMAYRRLVRPDERTAPSFLFESLSENDTRSRYSFVGAQPVARLIAFEQRVQRTIGGKTTQFVSDNPLAEPARVIAGWKLASPPGLPSFTGGWIGYAGYDTVRYSVGEKLDHPPADDRGLPDMDFALYRQVVVFDNVRKTLMAVSNVLLAEHESVDAAYAAGCRQVDALVDRIEREPLSLAVGEADSAAVTEAKPESNMSRAQFEQMVQASKKYIAAGDIFQVVLSQRFRRRSAADPFDIYRALRMVNPSPYMFYLQGAGCMLVGSSPEVLCRVQNRQVVNRPLAGTRRRSDDPAEDRALELELLADPKERAEHIMLVDLGRNDVGIVAKPGSVRLPVVMEIERYSHVMHISSTVVGELRDDLSCWDALRAALPVGTVSGAPKVRAMQIIDELEPNRRGPYAGAVGYADFAGNMDMCIALRTMVVRPDAAPGRWTIDLQAGAGIVADSVPSAEFQETVNKAAALGRAIDLAEATF